MATEPTPDAPDALLDPLAHEDLHAAHSRWAACDEMMRHDPEASLPLVMASVRDVPRLLLHSEALRQRVEECHDLLREAVRLSRPIGGGVQQRAAALLARHGAEGAVFPPTASRAG